MNRALGWWVCGSHLVKLGAGGGDLLDAELAKLSLELAELLHQIILGLVPQLDALDLARRLTTCQQFCSSQNDFNLGGKEMAIEGFRLIASEGDGKKSRHWSRGAFSPGVKSSEPPLARRRRKVMPIPYSKGKRYACEGVHSPS